MSDRVQRKSSVWRGVGWPLLGIVLLLLVNVGFDVHRAGFDGIFEPGSFLHIGMTNGAPNGALIDILNHGSRIVILAIGMTLVIATRGVDLSVGSVMAMAGAAAAVMVTGGQSAWIAIAGALGLSLVCGTWNGLLVSGLKLQPFIATLVLMVAGRGIAQMTTDGQTVTFHDPVMVYLANGRPSWLPLPLPFILAMALFGATVLTLRLSAGGLLLAATGANPEAARLSGVRTRLIMIGCYAFCGLCAGIAGLLSASNIKAADPTGAGVNAELGAIFAVVVGGTSLAGGRFLLAGSVAGAFLMQTLTTTMYARDVSAEVAPLPNALVILVVCLMASPELRRRLLKRRAKS